MRRQLTFFVSGMTCSHCARTVSYAINTKPHVFLSVDSVDVITGKVTVTVDAATETQQLAPVIREVLDAVGFSLASMDDAVQQSVSSHGLAAHEAARLAHEAETWRHTWMGALGVLFGLGLLLLMVFAGPFSWMVMAVLGCVSVLLTLYLGAEFYVQARYQVAQGDPAMDTLFALSTLTVIAVSIAAFFVPWLPMMFDVGLLVFGFRHVGLAVKATLLETTGIERSLQSDAPAQVKKCQDEEGLVLCDITTLRPNDVVYLEPDGNMIPIDGYLDMQGGVEGPLVWTTHVDGDDTPRRLNPGDLIQAGTILHTSSAPIRLRVRGVPAEVFTVVEQAPQVTQFHTERLYVLYPDAQQGWHVAVKTASEQVVSYPLPIALTNQYANLLKQLQDRPPTKLPLALRDQILASVPDATPYYKTSSHLQDLDEAFQRARSQKAPIQQDTEVFLREWFIPAVLIIALLSGVFLASFVSPMIGIQCAVAVLVAACPCTLGLITPLSLYVGMKKCHGVTFNREEALQKAATIDCVASDLFGTLTENTPSVMSIDGGVGHQALLFALEASSTHRVGEAIKAYTQAHDQRLQVDDWCEQEDGVLGRIGGRLYAVGNQTLLTKHGLSVSRRQSGEYVYLISLEPCEILAQISLRHRLKKSAKPFVTACREAGLDFHLITGSDQATADFYARELGVTHVCAKPTQSSETRHTHKEQHVAMLREQGKKVMVIGDALNDISAFGGGDVSVVVRHAQDPVQQVAPYLIQGADLVLDGEEFGPIMTLLAVAKQTMSNIDFNLKVSLSYNLIVVLLAAGVLVSVGIVLNPGIGVALMSVQMCLLLVSVYAFQEQTVPGLLMESDASSSGDDLADNDTERRGARASLGCVNRLSLNADGNTAGISNRMRLVDGDLYTHDAEMRLNETGNRFSNGFN